MSYLNIVVLDFFDSELLSVAGNVLSIFSFILTVFVLYDTRKIRSFYKFKARGPALIKELSKYSLNLSNYLNEYSESIPQIKEELGRTEAKLKSLEKKLSGKPKASVKQLSKSIAHCEVRIDNEDDIRGLYVDIIKVIEEIKDHQKDLNWEM